MGKKRQKHREEFGEIEFDDNTVFQMEHIIALMKEIDSKAGEMFEDDYRQNEPRHIAKDAKEERNNIELVRKVHEKAYNQLSGKEKIELEPIIHGGKSTTKYRSGTPDAPLIASLAKALRLSYEHLQENYLYVQKLNEELIRFFDSYKNVSVNHNSHCLPHILNISIIGVKPETFQHALEEFDIYVSTQSACSSSSNSSAVLAFTGSEKKASSSIRISLSAFTKASEINSLKKAFDICYQRLV